VPLENLQGLTNFLKKPRPCFWKLFLASKKALKKAREAASHEEEEMIMA